MTIIRCGFPANASGPSYFLLSGKAKNPAYSDEYLVRHGAAPFSTIIMTESGFLTDEAWKELVPLLIKGIRWKVQQAATKLGISSEKDDQLLIGLTFDGFKSHLKNLVQLVEFSDSLILCAVENRDSSEINQVCYNNLIIIIIIIT